MKKVVSSSERLERTLPIASGDRSKKWRERPGSGAKRRGGRRGTGRSRSSSLANTERGALGKFTSQAGGPKDRHREGAEGLARGNSGNKVNVYV